MCVSLFPHHHIIVQSQFRLQMGFTQAAHPEIPEKAEGQLPKDGASITKEMEDNIVTTVLEDLIIKSPPSGPVASGSGSNKVEPPASWKQQ
jgi:hypothetical protein